MRKIFFQWAGVGILALAGWGVDLMPQNTSWIPSGIIWGVALVWLIVTIVYWIGHRKITGQTDEARQEKIKYRQAYFEKKQIPDKLSELNTYLANEVKSQNISAKTVLSVGKEWFKWHDILASFFMAITYMLPVSKRIFAKIHVNFVVKKATKMNILLREYKLGTLPIIENDEDYKGLYAHIIQLESGLPPLITIKIHRFISFSISLNCLRLLSPERKYWKQLKATRWERQFKFIKSSLSTLLLPLDNAMTALLAEISKDIEGYFVGD